MNAHCGNVCPIGTEPVLCRHGNGLPCGNVRRLLPCYKGFDVVRVVAPFRIFEGVVSCRRRVMVTGGGVLVLLLPGSLISSRARSTVCEVTTSNMLPVSSRRSTTNIGVRGVELLGTGVKRCVARLDGLGRTVGRRTERLISVGTRHCNRVTRSTKTSAARGTVDRSDANSILVFRVFSLLEYTSCGESLSFTGYTCIRNLRASCVSGAANGGRCLDLSIGDFIGSSCSAAIEGGNGRVSGVRRLGR